MLNCKYTQFSSDGAGQALMLAGVYSLTLGNSRFEAAWTGDLEKIKFLTLGSWDEARREPPLKIAVSDAILNSPFSVAFFRGHYDVAWGIAEIAHGQYAPGKDEKKLYELKLGGRDDMSVGEDSENEYNSDEDDDLEPRIVAKKAEKLFTIDNIGEVSMQVQSEHKPLHFISMGCQAFESRDGLPDPATASYVPSPWDHFITHDTDPRTFGLYLDMCVHFGGKKYEGRHGTDYVPFTLPRDIMRRIVESGKVDLLREVIRRTGAGIPLDDLVKRTKVERKEGGGEYYQGLSVYGKKRYVSASKARRPRALVPSPVTSCRMTDIPYPPGVAGRTGLVLAETCTWRPRGSRPHRCSIQRWRVGGRLLSGS
jgi:hypothetical protein